MCAQKKSFLNKLSIFFIAIFAFIAMIAMMLCAICPLVPPNIFVWVSFFGLAFWPILFANIAFLLIFLFLKARKSLFISFLAIIFAVPGFLRSYSVADERTDEGNIKIMSYNIASFYDNNDATRPAYKVKSDIITLINKEKPDIVCLQECRRWNKKDAIEFAASIGCMYYSTNPASHQGNIIFSKFPLEDDSYTKSFNNCGAAGFVKLVKAGSRGTFYLENHHLKSYNITRDEIDYVGDTKNYVENSSTGKSIVMKLKNGFESRTVHTEAIVGNLPQNNTPVLVVGDFNDTPLSYTYHKMRKAGFNDAFLKVGHGVGKTYCGKLPMLRIDYFWYEEGIRPFTFKVVKEHISDHYPIVVTFNIM